MESYFYTQEQHKTNCGKLVASTLPSTLQAIGGKGTADDLLAEISYRLGQSEEIIEPQLKQVLRRAIRDGFLMRKGRAYLFPDYDVDARPRSSTMKSKERLAIASRAQNKRRRVQFMDQARTRSRSGSRQRQSKSKSKSGSR